MPVDPAVRTALSKMQGSFATARANFGDGGLGEWPEEAGDYPCFILGCEVKQGKFYDGKDKLDCVSVQFSYERIPDPNDPNADPNAAAKTFKGQPMNLLPFDTTLKEESSSIRREQEWGRFKAASASFMGFPQSEVEKVDNIPLETILGKIDTTLTGKRVVGTVRVTKRSYQDKKKPLKDDGVTPNMKEAKNDFIVEITSR